MLWKCEEKPVAFWCSDVLSLSIEEILIRFCECLLEQKLFNYFIRDCYIWARFQVCPCSERKLQYLVNFCESNSVKQYTIEYPFIGESTFSPSSLNTATHKVLFNACEYASLFTNIDRSKFSFLSKSEFAYLPDGMAKLGKAMLLQKRWSTEFRPECRLSQMMEIENCFFSPHSMLCSHDTDQVSLPASVSHLSVVELVSLMSEYYASDTEYSHHYSVKCENSVGASMAQPLNSRCDWFLLIVTTCLLNKPDWLNVAVIYFRDYPPFYYSTVEAFKANFYYVFAKDYDRASELCDQWFSQYSKLNRTVGHRKHCFVISNKMSAIYDKSIRTALGFYTLLESRIVGNEDVEVTLTLPMYDFMQYIRLRCLAHSKRDRNMAKSAVNNITRASAYKYSQVYHRNVLVFNPNIHTAPMVCLETRYSQDDRELLILEWTFAEAQCLVRQTSLISFMSSESSSATTS